MKVPKIIIQLGRREAFADRIVSAKRDLTHVFQDFNFCCKCPLHIASYALRIGVAVMELYKALNHTFQRKRYISIAHTGCIRPFHGSDPIYSFH